MAHALTGSLDQTFDLFDRLGGTDEQLDFPVVYASAINGFATLDPDTPSDNMNDLFEMIIEHVKEPDVDVNGPLQLQVSALDYDSYKGIIGIGRVSRGRIKTNTAVKVIDIEGKQRSGRVLQIMGLHGLERIEQDEALAGDIIAFSGMDELHISDTLCDPDNGRGTDAAER